VKEENKYFGVIGSSAESTCAVGKQARPLAGAEETARNSAATGKNGSAVVAEMPTAETISVAVDKNVKSSAVAGDTGAQKIE
jgi:hypothetical protein